MKSRYVRVVAVSAAMLLFSLSTFAQQQAEKQVTAPSLDGTTGLFKTWDAETLKRGETNWTVGYDMFRRDPGQLTIGRAPAGVAGGVLDRFELFGAMDVQKYVDADNIQFYRRLLPGQLPIPAVTPLGARYFSQAAPFMDVPEAVGRGDIHIGLKYNLLSERHGDPFSMGVAGFGTIPGQQNAIGISRGLSTGAYEGAFAFLLSKTVADYVRLHVNYGASFIPSNPKVAHTNLTDLSHQFFYKGGLEFPVNKFLRVISEVNGIKYFGTRTIGLNPVSPIDVIFGLRAYPTENISFGAGYQASVRHVADKSPLNPPGIIRASDNGFVAQGTYATRRNDPPTIQCQVDKQSILQGDTAKFTAKASDPDGDKLTYSWNKTGGNLTPTEDTAVFSAAGLAPGKYTVTATVKDNKHAPVSCSQEITVLKRNRPPTASVAPASFDLIQGESVDLRCNASDPDNDPLTYAWTVNGQPQAAPGPQFSFGSTGRNPGSYTVACTVSDKEATANASSRGNVREKPQPVVVKPEPVNNPPSIECLNTTMDVASGGSIQLRARASDPDRDPLKYSWNTTGGKIAGTGDTATFDATGVKAGSYTVTVTVNDGKGKDASCKMTVNVSERLSVTKDKCGYFLAGKSRVDNCAKAILDDLAVRMKNDSQLRANVIGYTDSKETGKKLGESRAKAVAAYLQKQGVDASRLTVTDGGKNNPAGDNKTVAGQKLNRRVEIELTVK